MGHMGVVLLIMRTDTREKIRDEILAHILDRQDTVVVLVQCGCVGAATAQW